MNNLIISILGNKVFFDIISEINLFKEQNIKFVDSDDNYIDKNANIIIYFINDQNSIQIENLKSSGIPVLLVNQSSLYGKKINNSFEDQITTPFNILHFESKIIATLAKSKFKKSSLIKLGKYILNKNEKKIEKDGISLRLTEKEINFLIFFSTYKKPLSKNFILENLWNYSSETDTHTVETHIHRLRKKIFTKFNDNNFIKNNHQGYYI